MCGVTFHFASFLVIFCRLTAGQTRGDTVPDPKYIDEAGQIVTTIFHKYREGVPPLKDYPKPVLIGVNLRVDHVRNLDTVAQVLESTVLLEVTWKDSRLSWYPLAVKEITITQDKIWSPTISIDNAVEPPGIIDNPKFVIKNNGDIYSYKKLHLKTYCATDLTSTEHNCSFVIGSNLLSDKVIGFDKNASDCYVLDGASSHTLSVSLTGSRHSLEEQSRWKEATTFPEFVCTVSVSYTPIPVDVVISDSNLAHASACCNNAASRETDRFHAYLLMLTSYIIYSNFVDKLS